jgi:hypothetical protein
MAYILTPGNLTFHNLELIFREKSLLALPPAAGQPVTAPSDRAGNPALAQAYLMAHTVGMGTEVPVEITRLALLILLQQLQQTPAPAISDEAINRLLAFYNREVTPLVQQQGLSQTQLAQLCLPLLGLGQVRFQDYLLNAADVLDIFSWQPLNMSLSDIKWLLNQHTFLLAETAHILLKLRTMVNWIMEVSAIFAPLTAVKPETLTVAGKMLMAAQDDLQRLWEAVVANITNQMATDSLAPALATLHEQLLITIRELAATTSQTFAHLIATTEPPATAGFNLANQLLVVLQAQLTTVPALSTATTNYMVLDATVFNYHVRSSIGVAEQVVTLAFWSIIQTGRIFNSAPGNLTLAAYYHSAFFVPKETISRQFEKIQEFIRTTKPHRST